MAKLQKPYKDTLGRWLTMALFVEKMEENNRKYAGGEPIFSLSGRPGYIDARQTFIELRDPTGFEWSRRYLESYEHFKRLLQCEWFVKEYNAWLDEMHAKLRAQAILNIQKISVESESDSQRLAASKYIAERAWEKADAPKSKRGRPSKAEIQGALKEQVDMSEQTRQEFERVKLKVVK